MSMVNARNLGFGGTGVPDTLPQAIAELQGMRMDVVTGAAAGTVMVIPGMDPEDHIGAAVDLTTPASIDPTTLSVKGRNAEAVISCLTTAVDGDTVVVNGRTYTFKDVYVHTSYNTPPGVVPIDITPSGSDQEEMADRLAKAIMSGDSTLTATVEADTASPPLMSKVRVKVRNAGTAGNAYTLTETGTAVTVSGAVFSGGTAAASAGFVCTANLTGKKVLVVWYDRHPGVATAPLMIEGEEVDQEETKRLGKVVFRDRNEGRDEARRKEDDDARRKEDDARRKEEEDRENDRNDKPGPGKPRVGR